MSKKKKSMIEPEDVAAPWKGFLHWMESAEGQKAIDSLDKVHLALHEVKLDVKKQLFLWPRDEKLSFSEAAVKIAKKTGIRDYSEIYDRMISWMEMHYEPEDVDVKNEKAMTKFEKQIDQWIDLL